VTENRRAFYQDVDRITYQTAYILLGASVLSIVLLFLFSRRLTRPLENVAGTMKSIISSSDLGERVPVEYRDETGQLAHTFNIMISELEKAYNQIKRYAFRAVLAQKKESRIRQIFQKYVPQELIDRFYKNPESMLVGDNRVLAILFSDIRSFSSISEGLMPDDLVNSLNQYFSVMVDTIMDRNGIVDKYIGDAIMAFFGAPVRHDDDALQSVLAGIEMTEVAAEFNRKQVAAGKPEFRIGVGINYGVVTVGNIGTDRKMDYTVIGDMVNLASRLEGLTKLYQEDLIISESLHAKVKDELPCRLLDTVAVKGKKRGTRIYTVRKSLSKAEERAWSLHNSAMSLYYNQNFELARNRFEQVLELVPGDHNAQMMIERCEKYMNEPPAHDWTGVEVMTTK
jgi:class 3 adenylate cyclase/HAMP domain-containing protein